MSVRDHVFWYNLKGYLILLSHEVGSCKHLFDFPCFSITKLKIAYTLQKHTFEQYGSEKDPH